MNTATSQPAATGFPLEKLYDTWPVPAANDGVTGIEVLYLDVDVVELSATALLWELESI
jgi:hypothetical protein